MSGVTLLPLLLILTFLWLVRSDDPKVLQTVLGIYNGKKVALLTAKWSFF